MVRGGFVLRRARASSRPISTAASGSLRRPPISKSSTTSRRTEACSVEREINTREVIFASAGAAPQGPVLARPEPAHRPLTRWPRSMLFSEQGEGGGPEGSVYLRSTDGAPAARLGDGEAVDLSPDGKWALTRLGHGPESRIVLLPTAAGDPRPISAGKLRIRWAGFLPPDGKQISSVGKRAGQGCTRLRPRPRGRSSPPAHARRLYRGRVLARRQARRRFRSGADRLDLSRRRRQSGGPSRASSRATT